MRIIAFFTLLIFITTSLAWSSPEQFNASQLNAVIQQSDLFKNQEGDAVSDFQREVLDYMKADTALDLSHKEKINGILDRFHFPEVERIALYHTIRRLKRLQSKDATFRQLLVNHPEQAREQVKRLFIENKHISASRKVRDAITIFLNHLYGERLSQTPNVDKGSGITRPPTVPPSSGNSSAPRPFSRKPSYFRRILLACACVGLMSAAFSKGIPTIVDVLSRFSPRGQMQHIGEAYKIQQETSLVYEQAEQEKIDRNIKFIYEGIRKYRLDAESMYFRALTMGDFSGLLELNWTPEEFGKYFSAMSRVRDLAEQAGFRIYKAGDQTFWAQQLAGGKMTPEQVLAEFNRKKSSENTSFPKHSASAMGFVPSLLGMFFSRTGKKNMSRRSFLGLFGFLGLGAALPGAVKAGFQEEGVLLYENGNWRVFGVTRDTGLDVQPIFHHYHELRIHHGQAQLFSLKGNGYVRMTPQRYPWGTSFVMPGYWSEGRYHHNARIRTNHNKMGDGPDFSVNSETGQLEMNGILFDEISNFRADDFKIIFNPNAPSQAVEMEVSFTLVAQKEFSIDPEKQKEHQGFKVEQFSTMNEGNEYDSQFACLVDVQGALHMIDMNRPGQKLFENPPFLSDEGTFYLFNHPVADGRNRPTTYIRVPDKQRKRFSVQGWITPSNDHNDDNGAAWLNDEEVQTKRNYKPGEVIGKYRFILGAMRASTEMPADLKRAQGKENKSNGRMSLFRGSEHYETVIAPRWESPVLAVVIGAVTIGAVSLVNFVFGAAILSDPIQIFLIQSLVGYLLGVEGYAKLHQILRKETRAPPARYEGIKNTHRKAFAVSLIPYLLYAHYFSAPWLVLISTFVYAFVHWHFHVMHNLTHKSDERMSVISNEEGVMYESSSDAPVSVRLEFAPDAFQYGLTPNLAKKIVEIISRENLHGAIEQGRSLILPLRSNEALQIGNRVFRAIKMKMVTFEGRAPRPIAYQSVRHGSVQPDYSIDVDPQGHISMSQNPEEPQGGGYFEDALNEYEVMRFALNQGASVPYGIGVGVFTDPQMKFHDQEMGFVIMAIEDSKDERLTDNIRKQFQALEELQDQKASLDEMRSGFYQVVRDYVDRAAQAGLALRQLHNAGVTHTHPYLGNFQIGSNGYVVATDLTHARQISSMTREQFIMYVLNDLRSICATTVLAVFGRPIDRNQYLMTEQAWRAYANTMIVAGQTPVQALLSTYFTKEEMNVLGDEAFWDATNDSVILPWFLDEWTPEKLEGKTIHDFDNNFSRLIESVAGRVYDRLQNAAPELDQKKAGATVTYVAHAHMTEQDFEVHHVDFDEAKRKAEAEGKEFMLIFDYAGPVWFTSHPAMAHLTVDQQIDLARGNPRAMQVLRDYFNLGLQTMRGWVEQASRGQMPNIQPEGQSSFFHALLKWAVATRTTIVPEDIQFEDWLSFNWAEGRLQHARRIFVQTGLENDEATREYFQSMEDAVNVLSQHIQARNSHVVDQVNGYVQTGNAIGLIYGAGHKILDGLRGVGLTVQQGDSSVEQEGLLPWTATGLACRMAAGETITPAERELIYYRDVVSVILEIMARRFGQTESARIFKITGHMASRWTIDEIRELGRRMRIGQEGACLMQWISTHGTEVEKRFFSPRSTKGALDFDRLNRFSEGRALGWANRIRKFFGKSEWTAEKNPNEIEDFIVPPVEEGIITGLSALVAALTQIVFGLDFKVVWHIVYPVFRLGFVWLHVNHGRSPPKEFLNGKPLTRFEKVIVPTKVSFVSWLTMLATSHWASPHTVWIAMLATWIIGSLYHAYANRQITEARKALKHRSIFDTDEDWQYFKKLARQQKAAYFSEKDMSAVESREENPHLSAEDRRVIDELNHIIALLTEIKDGKAISAKNHRNAVRERVKVLWKRHFRNPIEGSGYERAREYAQSREELSAFIAWVTQKPKMRSDALEAALVIPHLEVMREFVKSNGLWRVRICAGGYYQKDGNGHYDQGSEPGKIEIANVFIPGDHISVEQILRELKAKRVINSIPEWIGIKGKVEAITGRKSRSVNGEGLLPYEYANARTYNDSTLMIPKRSTSRDRLPPDMTGAGASKIAPPPATVFIYKAPPDKRFERVRRRNVQESLSKGALDFDWLNRWTNGIAKRFGFDPETDQNEIEDLIIPLVEEGIITIVSLVAAVIGHFSFGLDLKFLWQITYTVARFIFVVLHINHGRSPPDEILKGKKLTTLEKIITSLKVSIIAIISAFIFYHVHLGVVEIPMTWLIASFAHTEFNGQITIARGRVQDQANPDFKDIKIARRQKAAVRSKHIQRRQIYEATHFEDRDSVLLALEARAEDKLDNSPWALINGLRPNLYLLKAAHQFQVALPEAVRFDYEANREAEEKAIHLPEPENFKLMSRQEGIQKLQDIRDLIRIKKLELPHKTNRLERKIGDLDSATSWVPAPVDELLGLVSPWRAERSAIENGSRVTQDKVRDDPFQSFAYQAAISDQTRVVLIQGGPGSGKTQTLDVVIERLVQEGKKVLVTSATNAAVDTLLARLDDRGLPILRAYRVGQASSVEALARSQDDEISKRILKRLRQYWVCDGQYGPGKEVFKSRLGARKGYVIGVTIDSMDSIQETRGSADVVVIDEASTVNELQTIMAGIKATERIILGGDHKQTKPYVNFENLKGLTPTQTDLLTHSGLQNRFRKKYMRIFLARNYRCPKIITALVSRLFYDGLMISMANQPTTEETFRMIPVEGGNNERRGSQATEEEEGVRRESLANKPEAEAVVNEFLRQLETGVSPEQITVLTTYNAQVVLMRQMLERRLSQYFQTHGEEGSTAETHARTVSQSQVTTVQKFQGQENRVIIYSFVRSNPKGDVGHLAQTEMLNVAISRCKERLVLVGDFDTLKLAEHRGNKRNQHFGYVFNKLCSYYEGVKEFLAYERDPQAFVDQIMEPVEVVFEAIAEEPVLEAIAEEPVLEAQAEDVTPLPEIEPAVANGAVNGDVEKTPVPRILNLEGALAELSKLETEWETQRNEMEHVPDAKVNRARRLIKHKLNRVRTLRVTLRSFKKRADAETETRIEAALSRLEIVSRNLGQASGALPPETAKTTTAVVSSAPSDPLQRYRELIPKLASRLDHRKEEFSRERTSGQLREIGIKINEIEREALRAIAELKKQAEIAEDAPDESVTGPALELVQQTRKIANECDRVRKEIESKTSEATTQQVQPRKLKEKPLSPEAARKKTRKRIENAIFATLAAAAFGALFALFSWNWIYEHFYNHSDKASQGLEDVSRADLEKRYEDAVEQLHGMAQVAAKLKNPADASLFDELFNPEVPLEQRKIIATKIYHKFREKEDDVMQAIIQGKLIHLHGEERTLFSKQLAPHLGLKFEVKMIDGYEHLAILWVKRPVFEKISPEMEVYLIDLFSEDDDPALDAVKIHAAGKIGNNNDPLVWEAYRKAFSQYVEEMPSSDFTRIYEFRNKFQNPLNVRISLFEDTEGVTHTAWLRKEGYTFLVGSLERGNWEIVQQALRRGEMSPTFRDPYYKSDRRSVMLALAGFYEKGNPELQDFIKHQVVGRYLQLPEQELEIYVDLRTHGSRMPVASEPIPSLPTRPIPKQIIPGPSYTVPILPEVEKPNSPKDQKPAVPPMVSQPLGSMYECHPILTAFGIAPILENAAVYVPASLIDFISKSLLDVDRIAVSWLVAGVAITWILFSSYVMAYSFHSEVYDAKTQQSRPATEGEKIVIFLEFLLIGTLLYICHSPFTGYSAGVLFHMAHNGIAHFKPLFLLTGSRRRIIKGPWKEQPSLPGLSRSERRREQNIQDRLQAVIQALRKGNDKKAQERYRTLWREHFAHIDPKDLGLKRARQIMDQQLGDFNVWALYGESTEKFKGSRQRIIDKLKEMIPEIRNNQRERMIISDEKSEQWKVYVPPSSTVLDCLCQFQRTRKGLNVEKIELVKIRTGRAIFISPAGEERPSRREIHSFFFDKVRLEGDCILKIELKKPEGGSGAIQGGKASRTIRSAAAHSRRLGELTTETKELIVVSVRAITESSEFKTLVEAGQREAQKQNDPVFREVLLKRVPAFAVQSILNRIQQASGRPVVLVGELSSVGLDEKELRHSIPYLNMPLELGIKQLQWKENQLWILASVGETSHVKARAGDVIRLLSYDETLPTKGEVFDSTVDIVRSLNTNLSADNLKVCHLSGQVQQDQVQRAQELLARIAA